ncbi:MAG: hypothetical protein GXO96_00760 [Nitrospirae bacterium]|nr:hypothetical protein [Candidatus Manganitrophaceae bacterium]
MTRKIFASLILVSVILITNTSVFSADLKKHERLFTEEYSRVFDATVAVLTENGFGTHPHKKMKVKKEKGRIKTPEWRYFKIWSAKPVVEKQYKDSYKVKVKEIEIEVAQPAAEKKADEAPATDAAPAATPETAPTEAVPADGTVVTEAAPAPIPTIKKVKVAIKRKFLVHNDATRKWDKGDPAKENAGFSIEVLFAAIQEKLDKEPNPAVDITKQLNLNITPPPIDRVVRP